MLTYCLMGPDAVRCTEQGNQDSAIKLGFQQVINAYNLWPQLNYIVPFITNDNILSKIKVQGDKFSVLEDKLIIPVLDHSQQSNLISKVLYWMFNTSKINKKLVADGNFFSVLLELQESPGNKQKIENTFGFDMERIGVMFLRTIQPSITDMMQVTEQEKPSIQSFSNTILIHPFSNKEDLRAYICNWIGVHNEDSNLERAETESDRVRSTLEWYNEIVAKYDLKEEINLLTGNEDVIPIVQDRLQFESGRIILPTAWTKRTLEREMLNALFGVTSLKKDSKCTKWYKRLLSTDQEILHAFENATGLFYDELQTFKVRESSKLENTANAVKIKVIPSIKCILVPEAKSRQDLYFMFKNWIQHASSVHRMSFNAVNCQSSPFASLDLNDQPLPEGWEMRVDTNGRHFYANHNERIVQWNRPEPGAPASQHSTSSVTVFQTRRTFSSEDSEHWDFPRTLEQLLQDIGEEESDTASTPSAPLELLITEREIEDIFTDLEAIREEDVNGQINALQIGETFEEQTPEVLVEEWEIQNIFYDAVESLGDENNDALITEEIILPHTVEDIEQNPLPPGWESKKTPGGRVFFIDHINKNTTFIDPRTGEPSPQPGEIKRTFKVFRTLPDGWEENTTPSGRVFFVDHANKVTTWTDPRSKKEESKKQVPYSRDYKHKYERFLKNISKLPCKHKKFDLPVRRSTILQDSYRAIMSLQETSLEMLRAKLWISFQGEDGLDYGGLSREWFSLISNEIFNPYYGLFEYSASDNYTLQINPSSELCIEHHLQYFRFVGRIAGMAAFHNRLLNGFFIRPFYKMMLNQPILLKDMEQVDAEYHNSLVWIQDNDPACLELTFDCETEAFGEKVSHELKPGGRNIPVTEENKLEYIQLVINWRFNSRIKPQMDMFLMGFNDVIPLNYIKMFDSLDLELLLSGVGTINVEDWRKNTVYKGGYSDKDPVVGWFWSLIKTFGDEMRSRLLQFVTGTSRVPMNGFKVSETKNIQRILVDILFLCTRGQ